MPTQTLQTQMPLTLPTLQEIIIVCLGHCLMLNGRKVLSYRGVDQMHGFAERMKPRVNGAKLVFLTSMAPEALEGAEIIGKFLDVAPKEHHILWVDHQLRSEPERVLALIEQYDQAEVLIVLTHARCADDLISLIGFSVTMRDGQAVVIDCHERTCTDFDKV